MKKKNKNILLTTILGAASIVPIATVVSCSEKKDPYAVFIAENFKITNSGMLLGFADESYKHRGPLTIKESYNGVTIKKIGSYAFKDQSGIKGLTLPKTIESIRSYAFAGIGSPSNDVPSSNKPVLDFDLSHLTNLKEIEEYAFYDFSGRDLGERIKYNLNLSGLINLEIIKETAFGLNDIVSINFNGLNNLKEIGSQAFLFHKINGILDLSSLNNLEIIGSRAFEGEYNTGNITKIIWPSTSKIKSIGIDAFNGNKIPPANQTFPPGLTAELNNNITLDQIFSDQYSQ